jgi:hypothetical protein
MATLQVLTFATREALEALGFDSNCQNCHDEIEAVGPTIAAGEAPIETLFTLEAEGPRCALCVLELRKNDIAVTQARLEHQRQERRRVEQDIVTLTGHRPD